MSERFTEEWLQKHMARFAKPEQKRDRAKVSNASNIPKDRFKNAWEREYARNLELQQVAGEIIWWGYECWGFRLAKKTFHYPDFPVVLRDGFLEIREIKGWKQEKWLVKFKTCREMYPFIKWRCFQKKKGRWEEIDI